jgi:prepilin-type N-terminal cleavage/methylation domain-containing protein
MRKRNPATAFTLIELLAVIAIIAILASIIGPSLTHLRKGDAMASGTRQMLDAVARARQLAISQRTTVYLVFVEDNFWGVNPAPFLAPLTPQQQLAATNIADKQLIGYNFVSLRTVGDQPGRGLPRYLSAWQSLPDSIFIQPSKFSLPGTLLTISDPAVQTLPAPILFQYYSFNTISLPFPTEDAPLFKVPAIAFDYQGRLLSGRDEYIPMMHGSLSFSRDAVTKLTPLVAPVILEAPPGNATNSYNVIHIDWLTGRAHLEKREIK